jgi:glycosyltransferase involved in cell wall biosynthesis
MSNALLEAMALGVPCIATDISGSRDLIQSGQNGLLVPPENPNRLGDAILELLGNSGLSSRLGQEARKTVSRDYTLENVSGRYSALYEALSPP